MSDQREPDFYVGYQRRAPPGLARWLAPRIGLLLLLTAAVAVLLAAAQGRFEAGVFEFGKPREFEGTIYEHPYPRLEVEPPGGGGAAASAYHLVGLGKHGAAARVEGLDGSRVRLSATLIYRGEQTMLELVDNSVEVLTGEGNGTPEPIEDLGVETVVGEIVDSKCYLGVMKPARRRPHRACAALCIRGGIPPLLVTSGSDGRRHLLLVDERGRPVNDRVLDLVAEPIEITGHVTRQGNLLYLAADPAYYRRSAG